MNIELFGQSLFQHRDGVLKISAVIASVSSATELEEATLSLREMASIEKEVEAMRKKTKAALESAVLAPTSTPAGLGLRERFNYEITKSACMTSAYGFFANRKPLFALKFRVPMSALIAHPVGNRNQLVERPNKSDAARKTLSKNKP